MFVCIFVYKAYCAIDQFKENKNVDMDRSGVCVSLKCELMIKNKRKKADGRILYFCDAMVLVSF